MPLRVLVWKRLWLGDFAHLRSEALEESSTDCDFDDRNGQSFLASADGSVSDTIPRCLGCDKSLQSENLEKVLTVDFSQNLAQKVGTRSGQCRSKVRGRFAFPSAPNARVKASRDSEKYFPKFSRDLPGVLRLLECRKWGFKRWGFKEL